MRLNEGERVDALGRVLNIWECLQGCRSIPFRHEDHGARVVDRLHGTHPLRFGGVVAERSASLVRHPEASLCRCEGPGNPRRQCVHPREQRLRPGCRCELLQRRLMLPASGVQLARRHVQEHRRGRVNVWLGNLPRMA